MSLLSRHVLLSFTMTLAALAISLVILNFVVKLSQTPSNHESLSLPVNKPSWKMSFYKKFEQIAHL